MVKGVFPALVAKAREVTSQMAPAALAPLAPLAQQEQEMADDVMSQASADSAATAAAPSFVANAGVCAQIEKLANLKIQGLLSDRGSPISRQSCSGCDRAPVSPVLLGL